MRNTGDIGADAGAGFVSQSIRVPFTSDQKEIWLSGKASAVGEAESPHVVKASRLVVDGYEKRSKVLIGHDIGKFEICGMTDGKIVLKQIHARSGHKEQASCPILRDIGEGDGWVDLE